MLNKKKESKFSGLYKFQSLDRNDAPIYASEDTYAIKTLQNGTFSVQNGQVYLGKQYRNRVQESTDESTVENGVWTLNTRADMMGDYFAEIETHENSLRVPLFPDTRSTLNWASLQIQGPLAISVPDKGNLLEILLNLGQFCSLETLKICREYCSRVRILPFLNNFTTF